MKSPQSKDFDKAIMFAALIVGLTLYFIFYEISTSL